MRVRGRLGLPFIMSHPKDGDGTPDPILKTRQVTPWLYRGARPGRIGIIKLKEMDIRTIINLEAKLFEQEPWEVKKERAWASEAGIRFEHVPMHPIWAPRAELIDRALALIQDPTSPPIYIHCAQGVDRTGLIIAAYRVKVEGWTPQQASEEMARFGFHRYLFWWKRALSDA